MRKGGQIKELLFRLMELYGADSIQFELAKVNSVDMPTLTCECTAVSGDAPTDIPTVQLLSENGGIGCCIVPKVGTNIIVAITKRNGAYLFSASDIDRWLLNVDNGAGGYTSITVTENAIQLNDGTYGGLVIGTGNAGNNITDQLNTLNDQVQALITVLSNWTPVGGDGGAALKLAIIDEGFGSVLPEADFSQILNPLITQGQ